MAEEAPTNDAVAPGSVLAQLRKHRASHQQERHTDLEIPGYGGKLYGRFAPVPWETLRGIAQRADRTLKNNPRRDLVVAADTLLHACQMILATDADGKVTPLHEHSEVGEEEPIRFDLQLATLLGIEGAKTSREIILAIFPDDLAVMSLYVEFVEWQGDADAEADEALFQDGS